MMKRYIVIFAFLLLAFTAQAKEVFNINRSWKFTAVWSTWAETSLEVNLPHTWNNDALGGVVNYQRGSGKYLRELNIPASWSGERIFVRFKGASNVATVYLNGHYVGEHKGGSTGFVFEITDHVNFGRENTIVVFVNNALRSDVLPVAGEATQYGGLYRDVEIVRAPATMIALTHHGSEGVYIMQNRISHLKAEAEAVVTIDGQIGNSLHAELKVTDAEGNIVTAVAQRVKSAAANQLTIVKIPLTVNEPRLWQGKYDPHLYTVEVKLINNGSVIDSVNTITGFRSITVGDEGLLRLNGQPYPLRGVVVTRDRSMVGSAVRDFHIEEDVSFIREIGANAVRVYGGAHHEEFYSWCDKEGVIVWTDIAFMGLKDHLDLPFADTPELRENASSQLLETIYQRYNNPSACMWGIFSEVSSSGATPYNFILELNKVAKQADPSRPTVASSSADGDINFVTDLICWEHYHGWRAGNPSDIEIWRRQIHSKWRHLKSAVGYSAGGSIYHQGDTLHRPDFMGNWHPEQWQTHLHWVYQRSIGADSLFWGVFAGSLFDYGAAGLMYGDANGIDNRGLVTFDRKYRKDAFYLYKALWNKDDLFIHISSISGYSDGKGSVYLFTNCPQVELFVDGESAGVRENTKGYLKWSDIEVTKNSCNIRAVYGSVSDETQLKAAL